MSSKAFRDWGLIKTASRVYFGRIKASVLASNKGRVRSTLCCRKAQTAVISRGASGILAVPCWVYEIV